MYRIFGSSVFKFQSNKEVSRDIGKINLNNLNKAPNDHLYRVGINLI